jgi:hypothetical protein
MYIADPLATPVNDHLLGKMQDRLTAEIVAFGKTVIFV